MEGSTQKVVCYIVREEHLLVFRHLDQSWDESGLQVPAGTIKHGETPYAAALREATEETGLDDVRVVRKLGECDYDMRPYRCETHHRHVFQLAIGAPTPSRWTHYEEDPEDGSAPIAFECYWIPLEQGHVLAAGQGALLGHVRS